MGRALTEKDIISELTDGPEDNGEGAHEDANGDWVPGDETKNTRLYTVSSCGVIDYLCSLLVLMQTFQQTSICCGV